MLELTGIAKTFFAGTVNERRALQDVNLRLAPAEFVTVIGSNGAGKSTLLNIVAGALTPDREDFMIPAFVLTRSSRLIPGLRAIPAVMITKSESFVSS